MSPVVFVGTHERIQTRWWHHVNTTVHTQWGQQIISHHLLLKCFKLIICNLNVNTWVTPTPYSNCGHSQISTTLQAPTKSKLSILSNAVKGLFTRAGTWTENAHGQFDSGWASIGTSTPQTLGPAGLSSREISRTWCRFPSFCWRPRSCFVKLLKTSALSLHFSAQQGRWKPSTPERRHPWTPPRTCLATTPSCLVKVPTCFHAQRWWLHSEEIWLHCAVG